MNDTKLVMFDYNSHSNYHQNQTMNIEKFRESKANRHSRSYGHSLGQNNGYNVISESVSNFVHQYNYSGNEFSHQKYDQQKHQN